MTPIVALFIASTFLPDAYTICGPKPDEKCLTWVDQCLRKNEEDGVESDLSFEWCAEEVDPNLVHWGEFPAWPK